MRQMPSAKVQLHEATDADLPRVKNLVPYYIYDMSERMGWPCTPDGRFDGCNGLETYWHGPGKHAFVLRAAKELAGFVLILADNDDPSIDYSVTDFLVLRKFRGRGVGERIARQLFNRFCGRWKVEQLAGNRPAIAFWRTVIDRYCRGQFKRRKGRSEWGPMNVLLFDTRNGHRR
jgi:predicted acetyltransferase